MIDWLFEDYANTSVANNIVGVVHCAYDHVATLEVT